MLHRMMIDSPFPHFVVRILGKLLHVFLFLFKEISISRLLHNNLDASPCISQRLVNSILEFLDFRVIFTVLTCLMN